MISQLKLIGLATAAALALIIPAGAASAAEGVALRSGTLRAGPGSDFPSVDQISRGESIEIYGCTEDYAWCDISNDDNRGWFPGSRVGYVEDGRRVVITEAGPSIGLAILGFSVGEYWGAHYHNRSFYNRWHRYEGFDRYGPPRGPRPGPGFRPDAPRPQPGFRPEGPRQPWQQPNYHNPRVEPDQVRPQPQFQHQPRPEFRPPVQQQPRPEFRPPVQHQPQVQAPRPQPQVQAPRPQPQVQAPRPQPPAPHQEPPKPGCFSKTCQ